MQFSFKKPASRLLQQVFCLKQLAKPKKATQCTFKQPDTSLLQPVFCLKTNHLLMKFACTRNKRITNQCVEKQHKNPQAIALHAYN